MIYTEVRDIVFPPKVNSKKMDPLYSSQNNNFSGVQTVSNGNKRVCGTSEMLRIRPVKSLVLCTIKE